MPMPYKSKPSGYQLLEQYANDTHFLRLKIAPEMFHHYSHKMSNAEAKYVTCELLKITSEGFDYALKKDPLAVANLALRNYKVLRMRCEGVSPKSIGDFLDLSRTQIWRILKDFENKVEMVGILECRKIRGHGCILKPDMAKIEALRQKLRNLRPSKSQVNTPSRNLSNYLQGIKKTGQKAPSDYVSEVLN